VTMKPPHPGETIKEEFLVPLGMSVNALAKGLGIGATRLGEIVRGRRVTSAPHRSFGSTSRLSTICG
jgi:addiction module HigA family antidote